MNLKLILKLWPVPRIITPGQWHFSDFFIIVFANTQAYLIWTCAKNANRQYFYTTNTSCFYGFAP